MREMIWSFKRLPPLCAKNLPFNLGFWVEPAKQQTALSFELISPLIQRHAILKLSNQVMFKWQESLHTVKMISWSAAVFLHFRSTPTLLHCILTVLLVLTYGSSLPLTHTCTHDSYTTMAVLKPQCVFKLFPGTTSYLRAFLASRGPRDGRALGSKQCHTSELAPCLVTN